MGRILRRPEPGLPWQGKTPLLERIRAWDGGEELDLAADDAEEGGIRFASGAWDGIATHHMASSEEKEEAEAVYGLLGALRHLVRSGGTRERAALYQRALDVGIVRFADPFLGELARQKDFGPGDVRPHARWLLAHSAHPEPLKLGIVLAGACGGPEDLPVLRDLARHDEFTLYCAVAVANLVEDPVDEWWRMARSVRGWGRVHLVERLCERAEGRPDLQAWLLEEGWSNEVLDEYLALLCALAGDLAAALEGPDPSEAVLDGACGIIRALCNRSGPSPGLDSWPPAPRALERWLALMGDRCDRLGRLHAVQALALWLQDPDLPEHWPEGAATHLLAACTTLFGDPRWAERVRLAFRGEDPEEQYLAWELAPSVGVDLWEDAMARVLQEPLDETSWWRAARAGDPDRLCRLLDAAEDRLPLRAIASGPECQLGFGDRYRPHRCLDHALQASAAGRQLRGPLVEAALRSPVTRNRFGALAVLEACPRGTWGEPLARLLAETAAGDPEEPVRARAAELLGAG